MLILLPLSIAKRLIDINVNNFDSHFSCNNFLNHWNFFYHRFVLFYNVQFVKPLQRVSIRILFSFKLENQSLFIFIIKSVKAFFFFLLYIRFLHFILCFIFSSFFSLSFPLFFFPLRTCKFTYQIYLFVLNSSLIKIFFFN